MPGFEGDVTKSNAAVLRSQIKYQMETISKGENSQNNFCIQLLKLQLIENYDNFINSLKNKNPEEMMLKNQSF